MADLLTPLAASPNVIVLQDNQVAVPLAAPLLDSLPCLFTPTHGHRVMRFGQLDLHLDDVFFAQPDLPDLHRTIGPQELALPSVELLEQVAIHTCSPSAKHDLPRWKGRIQKILTIRLGRRSYRLVSTKTVGMRVGSRNEFRRSGAPLDDSGRVFLWSGVVGGVRACRSREARRSSNRSRPATRMEAVGLGSERSLRPMSEPAFGDNVTRLFDPDTSNHYALSEDAQLELRQLFRALDAVATLADTPPNEDGPEITPRHLSPLFFTLARHGERIMAEAKTRHAKTERKTR